MHCRYEHDYKVGNDLIICVSNSTDLYRYETDRECCVDHCVLETYFPYSSKIPLKASSTSPALFPVTGHPSLQVIKTLNPPSCPTRATLCLILLIYLSETHREWCFDHCVLETYFPCSSRILLKASSTSPALSLVTGHPSLQVV